MKDNENESNRVELAKLQKIFQLILLLKNGTWTLSQLGERVDISRRTTFRYLKFLRQFGFVIQIDALDRYQIITSSDDPTEIKFTIEELQVLRQNIQSTAAHPLNGAMLKKLSLLSEMDIIPGMVQKAHLGALIEKISIAIRNKHQMNITYHSANSDKLNSRTIDPIHFSKNGQSLIALDHDDKKCKQFKIDRIGVAEELRLNYGFIDLHEKHDIDIFGMSGMPETMVTLKLKTRAYLLLKEEFPLAIPFITDNNGDYTFHGPVVNFNGIGRFIMGLPREIEVVCPIELDHYIANEIIVLLNKKRNDTNEAALPIGPRQ